MTHRIHLRGHWEVSEPSPGRVRFVRRFGRPRLPEPGLIVRLVVGELAIPATVQINSLFPVEVQSLPVQYVLGDLAPRNVLTIECGGTAATSPPEAVIEIECESGPTI